MGVIAPPNAIIAQIEGVRSRRATGETLLTLAVPSEHSPKIAQFLTRVGEWVGVAFAEIEKNTPPSGQASSVAVAGEESPPAGGRRHIGLAEHLHLIRYFHNVKLWDALAAAGIYSQEAHKAWIAALPCHYIERGNCSGDVCAHHVASAALPAAGAGDNPRKPPHWFTLPLCHTHHTFVHNKNCSREEKQDLLIAAVALMAGQARALMKGALGLASLADLQLDELHRFEHSNGLPLLTGWEAQ